MPATACPTHPHSHAGGQTGTKPKPFVRQAQGAGTDKRGAKVDELHLAPLELIPRIATLATSAQPAKQVVVQTEPAATGEGAPGAVGKCG